MSICTAEELTLSPLSYHANGEECISKSLKALSFNVEGLSLAKAELISNLCKFENCDILCLQETHRDEKTVRPRIAGMKLITELPLEKYSSAIFCKIEIQPTNVLKINQDDIELLTIETEQVAITSIYSIYKITCCTI